MLLSVVELQVNVCPPLSETHTTVVTVVVVVCFGWIFVDVTVWSEVTVVVTAGTVVVAVVVRFDDIVIVLAGRVYVEVIVDVVVVGTLTMVV